ncbi:hypothetical protein N657DRAFT_147426 [Parathielavia appendiculata]|uniref:Uncharacterized protein n=1 Tax=Parathielavia appendiculata TaxID=2587402 RepID=A0AAN6TUC8_9PEZI|nr:hypothetical protein N657DRAFT_147426 [Parathielavia appendiculata]
MGTGFSVAVALVAEANRCALRRTVHGLRLRLGGAVPAVRRPCLESSQGHWSVGVFQLRLIKFSENGTPGLKSLCFEVLWKTSGTNMGFGGGWGLAVECWFEMTRSPVLRHTRCLGALKSVGASPSGKCLRGLAGPTRGHPIGRLASQLRTYRVLRVSSATQRRERQP